ncbi:MAG: primosomal protein N' [Desulfobacterales bacterium]
MKQNTTNSASIEVAVAFPADKTFVYAVPDSLAPFVSVGKRVLIPFGKRRITGYVLGFADREGNYDLRCILDVLDDVPLFPPEMIAFFKWVSDYYLYPAGEVIKNALPGGLNLSDSVTLGLTEEGKNAHLSHFLNPTETEILERLKKNNMRIKELSSSLNREIPLALIQSMEKRGWIVRQMELTGATTRARTERCVSPVSGISRDEELDKKLSVPRKEILRILEEHGEISVKKLREYVPTAANLIASMAEQGLIRICERNRYRDPFGESIDPDREPELTAEQQTAVSAILSSLGKGFATWLLAGVTGSGKTEVYLRLAAAAMERGLPVLMLVPEIALISQTERRFRARFGEKIAVLHSGLSAGERYDQWMRILSGEALITVGARSAIFAPYPKIGLVIVDEEHDTSYKQGKDLLYNARDLAVVRARQSDGVAVLGSATPSLQSFYNVRIGKFREVHLSLRVERRPLPRISIVDLRKIRDERGARRFITPELHRAVAETLQKGEQVLLFLNRRGFASFPVCAGCGEPIRCPHCDITQTFHRLDNVCKCHYCGFTREAPMLCPSCGSVHIQYLGMGTEKVEDAVKKLFPEARVARMDRDTTSRKGSVLKILRALKNQAIDVLIGTQMVTKGHDFPHITLVGIICADLSLSFPDFRAGEQTFQILAQVAGRAGRGQVPGQVILQTYAPDHFSILAAQKQDFRIFYQTEIGFRRALGYPPFTRMIQLRISGKDREKTQEIVQRLGESALTVRQKAEAFRKYVDILGPIEASVAKIADRYRWQMLVKSAKAKHLRRFVRQLCTENTGLFQTPGVRIVIDVDPFFMT